MKRGSRGGGRGAGRGGYHDQPHSQMQMQLQLQNDESMQFAHNQQQQLYHQQQQQQQQQQLVKRDAIGQAARALIRCLKEMEVEAPSNPLAAPISSAAAASSATAASSAEQRLLPPLAALRRALVANAGTARAYDDVFAQTRDALDLFIAEARHADFLTRRKCADVLVLFLPYLNHPHLVLDWALSYTLRSKPISIPLGALMRYLRHNNFGVYHDDFVTRVLSSTLAALESGHHGSQAIVQTQLELIIWCAMAHPERFNLDFPNVVDVLIGWLTDISVSRPLSESITGTVTTLHELWAANMQFSLRIVAQLLDDLETLSREVRNISLKDSSAHNAENQKQHQPVFRLLAFMRALKAVLAAISIYFSPAYGQTVAEASVTSICRRFLVVAQDGAKAIKKLHVDSQGFDLVFDWNMQCMETVSCLAQALQTMFAPFGVETLKLMIAQLAPPSPCLMSKFLIPWCNVMIILINACSSFWTADTVQMLLHPQSVICSLRSHKHGGVVAAVMDLHLAIFFARTIVIVESAFLAVSESVQQMRSQLQSPSVMANTLSTQPMGSGSTTPTLSSALSHANNSFVGIPQLRSPASIPNPSAAYVELSFLFTLLHRLAVASRADRKLGLCIGSLSYGRGIVMLLTSTCLHRHVLDLPELEHTAVSALCAAAETANVVATPQSQNKFYQMVHSQARMPPSPAQMQAAESVNAILATCLCILEHPSSTTQTLECALQLLASHLSSLEESDQAFRVLRLLSHHISHSEARVRELSLNCVHVFLLHGLLQVTVSNREHMSAAKELTFDIARSCLLRMADVEEPVRAAAAKVLPSFCGNRLRSITAPLSGSLARSLARLPMAPVFRSAYFLETMRILFAITPTPSNDLGSTPATSATVASAAEDEVMLARLAESCYPSGMHFERGEDGSGASAQPSSEKTTLDMSDVLLCRVLRAHLCSWEAARFIVAARLRTPLGDPAATLQTLARHLQTITSSMEQSHDQHTDSSKQNDEEALMILTFIDQLERALLAATDGSRSYAPFLPAAVQFFNSNRSTCVEWLGRLRAPLCTLASSVGAHDHTVHHGFERLRQLSADSRNSLAFERTCALVAKALIRLEDADSLNGLAIWARGCKVNPLVGAEETSAATPSTPSTSATVSADLWMPWLDACVLQARGWLEKAAQKYQEIAALGGDNIGAEIASRERVTCSVNLGHWEWLEQCSKVSDGDAAARVSSKIAARLTQWQVLDQNSAAATAGAHLLEIPSVDDLRASQMIFGKGVDGATRRCQDALVYALAAWKQNKKAEALAFCSYIEATGSATIEWRTCSPPSHLAGILSAWQCSTILSEGIDESPHASNMVNLLRDDFVRDRVEPTSRLTSLLLLSTLQQTNPALVSTSIIDSVKGSLARNARNQYNYTLGKTVLLSRGQISPIGTYEEAKLCFATNEFSDAVKSMMQLVSAPGTSSISSRAWLSMARWCQRSRFIRKHGPEIVRDALLSFKPSAVIPNALEKTLVMPTLGDLNATGRPDPDLLAGICLSKALSAGQVGKSWHAYAGWCYKAGRRVMFANESANPAEQTDGLLNDDEELPVEADGTTDSGISGVVPLCTSAITAYFNYLQMDGQSLEYHLLLPSALDTELFDGATEGSVHAKNSERCITATLRLLRLLIKFGHLAEVDALFADRLRSTLTQAWLAIIPQLFARLSHPRVSVCQHVMSLLRRIARAHPHAVVFPTVINAREDGSTSVGGQASAALLSVRQALVDASPLVAQEADIFVRELQSMSRLWGETWVQCLQRIRGDAFTRGKKAIDECLRVRDNITLDRQERVRIATEKHNIIMMPVLKEFSLTMDRTIALVPATPDEKEFVTIFKQRLIDLYNQLSTPIWEHADVTAEGAPMPWILIDRLATEIGQREHALSAGPRKLDQASPALYKLRPLQLEIPGVSGVRIRNMSTFYQTLRTKTRPKKLSIDGSDGRVHTCLLKGLEDLHLDERVSQFIATVNASLMRYGSNGGRARTYSVMPIGSRCGLIQWVNGCTPLFSLVKRWQRHAHEVNKVPIQRPGEQFHTTLIPKLRAAGIASTTDRRQWPLPVLRSVHEELAQSVPSWLIERELWLASGAADAWWTVRQCYARSLAVSSLIGYIIGLGDRHLDNILINLTSGEIVHIDYNVCFDKGRRLRVPERVPFRLTRTLFRALGPCGADGVFRVTFEQAMTLMRANRETLLTLLEAFVYDPVVDWTADVIADKERLAMEASEAYSLLNARIVELKAPLAELQSTFITHLQTAVDYNALSSAARSRVHEVRERKQHLLAEQKTLIQCYESGPSHFNALAEARSKFETARQGLLQHRQGVDKILNVFQTWETQHELAVSTLLGDGENSLRQLGCDLGIFPNHVPLDCLNPGAVHNASHFVAVGLDQNARMTLDRLVQRAVMAHSQRVESARECTTALLHYTDAFAATVRNAGVDKLLPPSQVTKFSWWHSEYVRLEGIRAVGVNLGQDASGTMATGRNNREVAIEGTQKLQLWVQAGETREQEVAKILQSLAELLHGQDAIVRDPLMTASAGLMAADVGSAVSILYEQSVQWQVACGNFARLPSSDIIPLMTGLVELHKVASNCAALVSSLNNTVMGADHGLEEVDDHVRAHADLAQVAITIANSSGLYDWLQSATSLQNLNTAMAQLENCVGSVTILLGKLEGLHRDLASGPQLSKSALKNCRRCRAQLKVLHDLLEKLLLSEHDEVLDVSNAGPGLKCFSQLNALLSQAEDLWFVCTQQDKHELADLRQIDPENTNVDVLSRSLWADIVYCRKVTALLQYFRNVHEVLTTSVDANKQVLVQFADLAGEESAMNTLAHNPMLLKPLANFLIFLFSSLHVQLPQLNSEATNVVLLKYGIKISSTQVEDSAALSAAVSSLRKIHNIAPQDLSRTHQVMLQKITWLGLNSSFHNWQGVMALLQHTLPTMVRLQFLFRWAAGYPDPGHYTVSLAMERVMTAMEKLKLTAPVWQQAEQAFRTREDEVLHSLTVSRPGPAAAQFAEFVRGRRLLSDKCLFQDTQLNMIGSAVHHFETTRWKAIPENPEHSVIIENYVAAVQNVRACASTIASLEERTGNAQRYCTGNFTWSWLERRVKELPAAIARATEEEQAAIKSVDDQTNSYSYSYLHISTCQSNEEQLCGNDVCDLARVCIKTAQACGTTSERAERLLTERESFSRAILALLGVLKEQMDHKGTMKSQPLASEDNEHEESDDEDFEHTVAAAAEMALAACRRMFSELFGLLPGYVAAKSNVRAPRETDGRPVAAAELADDDSEGSVNEHASPEQNVAEILSGDGTEEELSQQRHPVVDVLRTEQVEQEKNAHAVSVWKRVRAKLEGRIADDGVRLLVPAHVEKLIQEATSVDNLCRMYEGFTPWI